MTTSDTHGTTRAYLRISVASDASGSIQKQRERISAAEVAAGRDPGLVAWYPDEGVSGSRAVERPGRDRLLADLRGGDRLVALKVDRLARNVRDLLAIADQAKRVGATLTLVDDAIDTSGAMGDFLLTLLGAVAQLEAANTAERVRASRESFKAEGRHSFGKLPFGFIAVPADNGRGLVVAVDPAKGPVLRTAVERIIAGESQNIVRDSLGLSKTGFHKLIHNPRLAGMTPEGDGVVMVNGVPRIDPKAAVITMVEWQRLQTLLGKPDKAWTKQNGFGAALACGVCGERMYINLARNRDHSVYRCRKIKHTAGEPAPSIMVRAANDFLSNGFLRFYGDNSYTILTFRDDNADRTVAISSAMVAIAEIQRRMSAASDADAIMALAAELAEAHKARAAAEAMPSSAVEWEADTGERIADVWARSTDDEREALVLRYGRLFVRPGRGQPADRLVWVDRGDEALWSLDASTEWTEKRVGLSIRDIAAGVTVS
jgi:DNA invertase Pin-like site-specific DNA recombinase